MSILIQTALNLAIHGGIALVYWKLGGKQTNDLVAAQSGQTGATIDEIIDLSRSTLLQVMEECPAGFAILDMDGRWRIVNREVERILGRTSVELTTGSRWQDFTAEDEDSKEAQRQIQALLRGEIARYTIEKVLLSASGESVPVRETIFLGSLATVRVFVAYIEDMRPELIQREKQGSFRARMTERLSAQQRTIRELRSRLNTRGEEKLTEGVAGLRKTIERLKAGNSDNNCEDASAAVDK